ncbi:hypothetical protein [Flavivirga rizhaonensis]|uniref:Uncharacterized protein n=1 Tax=Flavivirga rizhaonensis TaxID=2559571 RepID=A0A4S1DY16_9FLAO|nr:hypothetical protein [Flavivirga rizhaonensis]TGV02432.1 hypothetical protein EM932_10795 [Flavivirga rizhaonensis]
MELGKDELIQELIELVFVKAIKASKKTKAYGISRYLEDVLNEKITERTLTRYYDGYILDKKSERRTPSEHNLNILSQYLGHENYRKFQQNREYEIVKNELRKEIISINNKLIKIKKIGLFTCLPLIIMLVLFISKYYKKDCMIWVNDHYKKVRCSEVVNENKLEEIVLREFKKPCTCKDYIFYKNEKSIVHYTRLNNNIDFFISDSKHPIFEGVYTNSITKTIIQSEIKPCSFIKISSKE